MHQPHNVSPALQLVALCTHPFCCERFRQSHRIAGAAATAVNTEAVDLLKQASKDPSVCKKDVFKALRDIQKQNLPVCIHTQ